MRFATLLLLCLCPLLASAQVRVVGSDLLKPALEPILEGYRSEGGERVEVKLNGSLAGSTAWADGKADILIEAILPGKPVPHDAVALAYSAVVVQVHKSNPVRELTLQQLASIYGQRVGAPLQRWGEVGVSGVLVNRAITPFIFEDRNSILLDQFRDSVLGNHQLRASVKRLTTTAEVQLTIGGDQGAIIVTDRLPPADSSARALPISKGGSGDFAFGPTDQNIHYGEYPLRLGYYIRYKNSEDKDIKGVLAVLLGDETAQRLNRQGFISTPQSLRKRFLQELDK